MNRLRLGNIVALRQRYESEQIQIGYSGHEVGIVPSVAAMQLGARMIERHFCVSRRSFAHHIECSLEPAEYDSSSTSRTSRPTGRHCWPAWTSAHTPTASA